MNDFGLWRARWWEQVVVEREDEEDERLQEGLRAYASEQACRHHEGVARRQRKWQQVLKKASDRLAGRENLTPIEPDPEEEVLY